MKRSIGFIIVIIAMMSGCISSAAEKGERSVLEQISVNGNIIYRNGRPFAELRFFDPSMKAESLTETTTASGLVMYYYDLDREVWIYPEKGMSIYQSGKEYSTIADMKRVWGQFTLAHQAHISGTGPFPRERAYIYVGGRMWSKEESIRGAYSIKISPDGKYVYYKTQGILFDSNHRYEIESRDKP